MLEKRQSFTFVWGFTLGDATTISQCTVASVFVSRDVQNGSAQPAVPPYTLIAYPDQGVPTVDLLGNGPDNMSWTPRFPAGTKLLISVVDALGNSGGVAQTLYTVASSGSSACIVPAPSSDLKVTIDNTPSTVQTCQTIPIRIQGGQKPYTLTIASTNSATATNATMDASNDYYQYINRMAPGQSMIAAISDSTGKYAPSTQFYTTAGSTDITCAGQTSIQSVYDPNGSSSGGSSPTTTSGGSSQTSAASADSNKSGGGPSLTGPIIGTILGLLAILGIIAYFFFRRRNSRNDVDSTHNSGGGFGMKDYKMGGNMPGNESFLPLSEGENLPRTPNGGGSPHQTAYGPPGRRQSAMDYYSAPSSNYGQSLGTSVVSSSQTGSHAPTTYGPSSRQSAMDYYSAPSSNYGQSMGTSAVSSSQTGPSQPTMSPPPPVGMGLPAGAGRPLTKREMMLRDQQRQQQWNNVNQPPQDRPESMYPPASTYTVNPFGDTTYPYNPPPPQFDGGAPTHSHAPSRSFGSTVALGLGSGPGTPTGPPPASTYKASPNLSHAGTGTGMAPRPSGSQDLSTMSTTMGAGMTPAAHAKAAEAAQDARRAYADEDDDDLLAYTQPRMVLGVTNPDRASVATSNTTASADPYGGTAGHVGGASTPTQIYQHEDAGDVVELPPAYREFSKTPGPGSAPRR